MAADYDRQQLDDEGLGGGRAGEMLEGSSREGSTEAAFYPPQYPIALLEERQRQLDQQQNRYDRQQWVLFPSHLSPSLLAIDLLCASVFVLADFVLSTICVRSSFEA